MSNMYQKDEESALKKLEEKNQEALRSSIAVIQMVKSDGWKILNGLLESMKDPKKLIIRDGGINSISDSQQLLLKQTLYSGQIIAVEKIEQLVESAKRVIEKNAKKQSQKRPL